uniref:serine--tRNA ligase n=1 Tax=Strombidinopsis acuminata TaxID=141414 RepID=A0A7S3WQ74_9SPIT
MAAVKPSFDFAYWAEHPEEVQKNADNRKFKCDVAEVVRLYNEHRAAAFDLTGVQKRRNDNAASMKGKLEPEVREKLIEEGKQIKAEIGELEAKVDELYEKMCSLAIAVPNLSHPETPIGDEENAKTLRIQGEPRTDENAGFKLKDHLEIGEVLDMFDFESGGKVSGQKFLYFKNGAALLEMALVQWSLHEAVKAGFTPHITPDLVREPVIGFCGFNPRDGEATQIYKVADSDLCLTGTAEIPMCGKFINETLIATQDLPQKLVAYGHAFRTEAGSSGSENRGIYRLHQFSKVELFGLTKGDTEASNKMLEEIRGLEEELFTKLGLCFRVLDMPTEELGAPAYRKYDIEAWMPGMEKWGEISSCSNCTDFQARRLNLRHKETYSQKGGLEYVHTLNGTACAVPRMIIAILETFQNEDGTVTIPEVLRPYMMGMDVLKPPK